MKILIVFNAVCMSVLMTSQLITAYQSYLALMEMQRIIASNETQTMEIIKAKK